MDIKKVSAVALFSFVALVFGFILMAGAVNAAVAAPQIGRDLVLGSKGEDVRSLQQFLNGSGYAVSLTGPGSAGFETITFGYATRGALIRFQAARGIPATGNVDAQTRVLFSSMGAGGDRSKILAMIELVKQQISVLQQQLMALLGNSGGKPNITSIAVANGGESGSIDAGDTITVTFTEAVKPTSISNNLANGAYVSGITSTQIGGVSVSESGVVTIQEIAKFDAGAVEGAGTFTAKLALSSNGNILTVTITGGSVRITDEDFNSASQIGYTVKDSGGDAMEGKSSIGDPTGTFGKGSGDSVPRVISMSVLNGGSSGYIDAGDIVTVTFNKALRPSSINSGLASGSHVSGVASTQTGGVSVSSEGVMNIEGIAKFDAGTVQASGTYAAKLALSSDGKVLNITLTSGSIRLTREDFSGAYQIGGTVKDSAGNTMESKSGINIPTGTFGGDSGDSPYITSIKVTDSGNRSYIDTDDTIDITFNKSIKPLSINGSLANGSYVSGVTSAQIGGVSVSAAGLVTIQAIATFDMGTAAAAGNFISKLALSSNGRVLTITLTGGSDISITDEDFDNAAQIGGAVEDLNGNAMQGDSSIDVPTGSFGGNNEIDESDQETPYITSITVANGGNGAYIDTNDTITINFSEAIEPESINNDLDEGDYITGVASTQIGGVSVSAAGIVTIQGVAVFDAGAVANSVNFTSRAALNSSGNILTVTLTSGSVRLTLDDFDSASQVGGIVRDKNNNIMASSAAIVDPAGSF